MTKQLNIKGSKRLDCGGAFANSCQMKTPQIADTIVAPCPIAYDTAGPTNCACEATKLSTVPVHQMAPPTIPHPCHDALPGKYSPIVSGAPLHLSMELESSAPVRINELAVLIHDALGRRIALLDLRSANGCHRTNGLEPAVFGVDVKSFPLVEGDYYLSIFIDSDDVVSEFRDLVSLTVIDDHSRRETITYPSRARGSVELDYRLRV